MDQIIFSGELVSDYTNGKNLLIVPEKKVIWGRIDNSILKIMGEREYRLLLKLGLINEKKIDREQFILRLRTAFIGIDFKFPNPKYQEEIESKLRDLEGLKSKFSSLGINFESYGENEMYLINSIKILQDTFGDVLVGDTDSLYLILGLFALNTAHEVLWAGFDFQKGKSEYIEGIKAKRKTNIEQ